MTINTDNYEYTENGIKVTSSSTGKRITTFNIKKEQTIKLGFLLFSKPTATTHFTVYENGEENTSISFLNFQSYNLNQKYERTYTATEDTEIYIIMWGNANSEIFEFQLWAEYNELTDYTKHEEEDHILDIQQEMLKGDYFVKEADGWKEVHLRDKKFVKNNIENAILSGTKKFIYISNLLKNVAKIPENNNIDVNTISNIAQHASYQVMADAEIDYGIGISNAGSLCIRIKDFSTLEEYKTALNNDSYYYYYYLATPIKLPCTEQQSEVLEQLNNMNLFEGTNNIITAEDIALLQANYVADTKMYIQNLISSQAAAEEA